MGHVLTIESDEAFSLATQLAALTGESLEAAIAEALRTRLAAAQCEQAQEDKARASLLAFHDLLDHPRPGSDHRWMYDDETGLPIW